MNASGSHICNIFSEIEQDSLFIQERYSKFPINLTQKLDLNATAKILIIGWHKTKELFPSQNIHDNIITENISWCHSSTENRENFESRVDLFIKTGAKAWLPTQFFKVDCFLSKKSLREFLAEEHLIGDKFIYFYKGAMYLTCNEQNFCVNIKNLSLGYPDWKEQVTELVTQESTYSLSYHNVFDYIIKTQISQINTLENTRWIKFGVETEESFFDIIPGVDMKRYIAFIMSKLKRQILTGDETAFNIRMCERDFTTCLLSRAELAISNKKSIENFGRKEVKVRAEFNLIKVHYSNKRTITGRIVAHDEYNPQNLPKEGPERSYITSKYTGGKILVFDFISFETVLSMIATEDDEFIKKYIEKDLHYETAALIYKKHNISEVERELSKNINHSLLYGAGQELLLDKLSAVENPTLALAKIKEFLAPIIKKASAIKLAYKENNYLVTDQGSIIRPEKDYAAFNNFIQATATEVIVDKILELSRFLSNKKSQLLFQVHDSLVFDIHPEEMSIIHDLKKISQAYKGLKIPVSIKTGENYKEGVKINL